MIWNPNHLDQFIVFPIDYGFVNNKDCFFVSNYCRTRDHPDLEGIDLRLSREDLRGQTWCYTWVDWTCMPQVPRNDIERHYFNRTLRCIPMIVRDCGFEWRFPQFEPRAWVLCEVAEFMLCHSGSRVSDNIFPFITHVNEMVRLGEVHTVIEKYGYRCTTQGDMLLITGWLEIPIILGKVVKDAGVRQKILDWLSRPYIRLFAKLGIYIDSDDGTLVFEEKTFRLTSVFQLRSGVESSFARYW